MTALVEQGVAFSVELLSALVSIVAFDMSALWREGHAFCLKTVAARVRFAPRTQMGEFVLSPFLRNKLVQVARLDPRSYHSAQSWRRRGSQRILR